MGHRSQKEDSMKELQLPPPSTINQYIADGVAKSFDYHYLLLQADDMAVYITPPGKEPSSADLQQGGYTVSPVGDEAGGQVTFDKAPTNQSIITLARAMPAELHTEFKNARNFSGEALDKALLRLLLLIQQNLTTVDKRALHYPQNAIISTSLQTTVPVLQSGEIWKCVNNVITNVLLEENPDVSTLRAELAKQLPNLDGARLIGYFDDLTQQRMTVHEKLNTIVPIFTTGDVKLTLKNKPDSGWVLMNDGTLGNAKSRATTRANKDTQALFELLWNNIPNRNAPVLPQRGKSAQADFNANKTIHLPKTLGRALAVAGHGGGLSPRKLGDALGEERHTLSKAEIPPHTHQYQHGNFNSRFVYSIGMIPLVYANALQGVSSENGQSSGLRGQAHNNMQPTSFMNVMIKL